MILLPALAVLAPSRPPGDAWDAAGAESITAAELRAIVGFLASDQMEGRQTGSVTNQLAAMYLANQLELLDLEPAGDRGGFLQTFTLQTSRIADGNRLSLAAESGEPSPAQLMGTWFPWPASASGEASGWAVAAGFRTGPEGGRTETEETPGLSGAVAVMPAGDPFEERGVGPRGRPQAPGGPLGRVLEAQRQGAIAVVLVAGDPAGVFPRLMRTYWPENAPGSSFFLEPPEPVRIPVVFTAPGLLEPWLTKVRGTSGASRDRAGGRSGLKLTLRVELERERTPTMNVLARLPGSDPLLRHEVVVVSAHLDHVGRTEAGIFNGADDDASGSAAVVEIAEAFVTSPARPRRSIVFALWNAEEHGLLGSRHFVDHPTVGLDRIRAVFQMDMIGRDQEVTDQEDPRFAGLPPQGRERNRNTVHLVGYSYSDDLRSVVQRAGSQVGLELLMELDRHPLNLVKRSDSWPFLLRGIPSALISTGLHPDYHTPDDLPDRLNYPKMERIARMVFLAAWQAADSLDPLELNPMEPQIH
ncbi:MAG: M20/M25/M40 family metallo-hydrolase [Acidobacteriota bacterium]